METQDTNCNMLSLDPAKQIYQDIYKLMIGLIVPRPIAFVSTLDLDGVRNLAPFSYFTAVSSDPPVVLFCPTFREGQLITKDTLRNVRATQEFVVNIVSEEFATQMNQCSAEVAPEVDEFELSGLTAVPSELVKPPRVAESHVHMECRLRQIVEISNKPGGGAVVLGEVLLFHVRREIFSNFRIDPDKLRAIGRMGGHAYCRTRDRFELKRPK